MTKRYMFAEFSTSPFIYFHLTRTVSVPEYKNPGEKLRVMAADGSGRIVTAIIPEGCTAGHSFLVQFPDFVPYTDELKLEEEETKTDDRMREFI